MKRKLMSLLLCTCMILTMVPISAFATDVETTVETNSVADNGDTTNVQDKDEAAKCICKSKCSEDAANTECAVCRENFADCAFEGEATKEPTKEPGKVSAEESVEKMAETTGLDVNDSTTRNVATEDELRDAVANASEDEAKPTVININDNINLSSMLTVGERKFVSINGNGHTISRNEWDIASNPNILQVEGSVYIENCTLDADGCTHVLLVKGGQLEAKDTNFTGANNATSYGAIGINNAGSMVMTGGSIYENESKDRTAVVADGGNFDMTNAKIYNNICHGGNGGVLLFAIYDKSANGGICGTITLKSGEIYNNQNLLNQTADGSYPAPSDANAVIPTYATFKISGSVYVHGNTVSVDNGDSMPRDYACTGGNAGHRDANGNSISTLGTQLTSPLEHDVTVTIMEYNEDTIERRTLFRGADGYTLTKDDLDKVEITIGKYFSNDKTYSKDDLCVCLNKEENTIEACAVAEVTLVNAGDTSKINISKYVKSELADPAEKTGYAFVGWYDNEEFTGTAVTTPVAGSTYYAKWVTVSPISVSNEQELRLAIQNSADKSDVPTVITLLNDIELSSSLIVGSNDNSAISKNIHIKGANKDITLSWAESFSTPTNSAMLCIFRDSSIQLSDIVIDAESNARVVFVNEGASLLISDGTTLKNGYTTGNAAGGGIMTYGQTTMNGGTIESCIAEAYGGGVCVDDENAGSFTMTNGTIKNCTATIQYGGAIMGRNGLIRLTGGTIIGNSAKNDGGAIWAQQNTIIKLGGELSITENYLTKNNAQNDLAIVNSDTVQYQAIGALTGTIGICGAFTNELAVISGNDYTLTEEDLSAFRNTVAEFGLYLDGEQNKIKASAIKTIIFSANYGDSPVTVQQSVLSNQAVKLDANSFTRTGYAFTGWNTAANGEGGTAYLDKAVVTLSSDITLYAQWEELTIALDDKTGENALTYDGTEKTLTATLENTSDAEFTYTYALRTSTAGDGTYGEATATAPTDAGYYKVVATLSGTERTATAYLEIKPADITAATKTVNVQQGDTTLQQLDLSTLELTPSLSTIGKVAYTIKSTQDTNRILNGDAAIKDGKLQFKLNEIVDVTHSATVEVTVTPGSPNYKPVTVTVQISVTKDTVAPTMSASPASGTATVIGLQDEIKVTFSKKMIGTPTVAVSGGEGTANGVLAKDGLSMVITPADLANGTAYTFTVNGLTDVAGNALTSNTLTYATIRQPETSGTAVPTITGEETIITGNDDAVPANVTIDYTTEVTTADQAKLKAANNLPDGYSKTATFFELVLKVNGVAVKDAVLNRAISITIPYSVEKDTEYKIAHLKADGSVEILDATADITAQTLTFSVKSLSPFMVLSKHNAPAPLDTSDKGAKTDTSNQKAKLNTPNTGDSSNTVLWMSLLLISGGALAAFGIYRKRKKENS